MKHNLFTAARRNAKYKRAKKAKKKEQKFFVFVKENVVIRNVKYKPQPKLPKLTDQLRAIDTEAITEPYDRVLVYFANGGQIHPSALKQIFGSATKEQRTQMFSLLNKKGRTIDQLAHVMWEDGPAGEERYTSQDYKDVIEQVLQVHISKWSAARELVDKYDYDKQYEKYAQRCG